jgi:hypothetical protein
MFWLVTIDPENRTPSIVKFFALTKFSGSVTVAPDCGWIVTIPVFADPANVA